MRKLSCIRSPMIVLMLSLGLLDEVLGQQAYLPKGIEMNCGIL